MADVEAILGVLGGLREEQLARVIEDWRVLEEGRGPKNLRDVAVRIGHPYRAMSALEACDLAELQVLIEASGRSEPSVRGAYGVRDVAEAEVVEGFAEEHREAVGGILRALRNRLILLPSRPGRFGLTGAVADALERGRYTPVPAVQLLTRAFNKAELQHVAGHLGVPPGTRAQLVEGLGALFADHQRIREVLQEAPARAVELMELIFSRPAPIATDRFTGWDRFVFRPGGSGDPGTDWLADRGLLVPVDDSIAEMPLEVFEAFGVQAAAEFVPAPPRVATVAAASAVRVESEARAAVTTAVTRLEALCRDLSQTPAQVRKSGGLAVRDTRRLAKAIGAPEDETRLWIDLADAAGILGVQAETPAPVKGRRRPEPAGPSRLMPSGRYDRWFAAPPAERLAPVIAAWLGHGNVITWWPGGETPVALVAADDPSAVALRAALLRVLASFPDGQGMDVTSEPALAGLQQAAAWHRPVLLSADAPARVAATLEEARLLGLVAHGALTSLGWAALTTVERRTGSLDALTDALAALLPPPVAHAHFQADMTAVVPGLPAPAVTDLLDSAADRESEGHAVVWRFSAATIRRALDSGLDPDALLKRLATLSTTPLPQPLEYLVRDVARRHGHITVIASACCIRSDDETLLLELQAHRSLRRLGLRRIAPTVVVSAEPPAVTLDALRSAGYTPVLEAQTGTAVVERAVASRTATRRPLSTPGPLELARNLLGKS
ncbi:helicase-associated domain-containing protein [Actinocorallia longicatena]|uniref:Helicase-associated domain-containing protein n=1 Tax=Actinocorallia longicatena TaxID=111803 RepID=A0ABP6QAD9_9ACTN